MKAVFFGKQNKIKCKILFYFYYQGWRDAPVPASTRASRWLPRLPAHHRAAPDRGREQSRRVEELHRAKHLPAQVLQGSEAEERRRRGGGCREVYHLLVR